MFPQICAKDSAARERELPGQSQHGTKKTSGVRRTIVATGKRSKVNGVREEGTGRRETEVHYLLTELSRKEAPRRRKVFGKTGSQGQELT